MTPDLYYLKPLRPGGHIDGCDVNERLELCIVMVSEECDDWDDAFGMDHHLQLVTVGHLYLLDVLWEAVGHVIAELYQSSLLEFIARSHYGCRDEVYM